MKQNVQLSKKKIALWFVGLLVAYMLIATALYFLMGQQLYYRPSDGEFSLEQEFNCVQAPYEQRDVLYQRFTTTVQRVQKICLGWKSAQLTQTATVTMTLSRADNGQVLAQQQTTLGNGNFVSQIDFDQPLQEANTQLLLTVQCDGWTPLYRVAPHEGFLLSDGVTETNVALNLSVQGQDFVWLGANYWWIVLAGFAVVAAGLVVAVVRYRRNGTNFVMNCFADMTKYRFLINQLVARDFKTKYKRSVLGVLWSFLNPLLTTFVLYFVFSNVFRSSGQIENYTAYLVIGVTMFNYFTECCNMCLTSIVGNSHMITKVFVPKYIYPLTRTVSSSINFALALIPLFLIVFINGLFPTVSWILILFAFVCMAIFCYGLGLLLASAMVFFRDTQFLWGVVCMLWMYITPVFYPADIIPVQFSWVQTANPLFHFIDFVRTCIMQGVSPDPSRFVWCLASAIIMLLVGGFVFRKTQNNFVMYI